MKYRVTVPYACFVTVEVEAESREEAEEVAVDESGITSFCGNGGNDKLIGVTGSECSIEAGDSPLEGIPPFEIDVEEIE